ncbi:hypothetical protein SAMN05192533_1208 [Mesobacillus persicus]|uniref:Uncharacterized protein n=1 Tax=Mesobacillus persicus TaxID=930146 RepID=A0A1H8J6C0_9BACI|nr:hypothetical protein [Mesobacillus persicus]SEN76354.1 hypothetical protein SAMN05192533_1208 [Mesobacillus persicus]
MGRKRKQVSEIAVESIEFVYRPGFEKEWAEVVSNILHHQIKEGLKEQGIDDI